MPYFTRSHSPTSTQMEDAQVSSITYGRRIWIYADRIAIHDPNTNITLWESCAINEYLVDRYDTEHKISHSTSPEKHLEKQYLNFQASGQGPYYGQGAWFNSFRPESLPSAKERHDKETKRIISVLDGILADRKYLVGGKLTHADLAFVAWDHFVDWCVAPKLGISINTQISRAGMRR